MIIETKLIPFDILCCNAIHLITWNPLCPRVYNIAEYSTKLVQYFNVKLHVPFFTISWMHSQLLVTNQNASSHNTKFDPEYFAFPTWSSCDNYKALSFSIVINERARRMKMCCHWCRLSVSPDTCDIGESRDARATLGMRLLVFTHEYFFSSVANALRLPCRPIGHAFMPAREIARTNLFERSQKAERRREPSNRVTRSYKDG